MSVDQRFYRFCGVLNEDLISSVLGSADQNAELSTVDGLASFGQTRQSELCFLEQKPPDDVSSSSGGFCLVHPDLEDTALGLGYDVIITQRPRESFFRLAENLFSPREALENGRTEDAKVHKTARLDTNVVLGPGVAIGPRTIIGAGSYIGPGVQIGSDCNIGAGTSISFSLIGNNVTLQSGVRLGEAGFGLLVTEKGAKDCPHFGRVIVQDGVSIGANSCVDRGVLGDTLIGENTKIDNLSHIGHNTSIGRHVVMAAYAGISGSVTIGDGVRLGGRVGISDHVTIGAGAQLAIGSLVLKDVPAGEIWAGNPARPIRSWQREIAWLKHQARRKTKRP